jgi:predicted ester cyclase
MKVASERTYESGNTAIDEWTFMGTHEGPLRTPEGESIPPTGKQVRFRGSDFATVENGLIVEHRAYFDQMEMLAQLGLLPQEAGTTSA